MFAKYIMFHVLINIAECTAFIRIGVKKHSVSFYSARNGDRWLNFLETVIGTQLSMAKNYKLFSQIIPF